MIDVHAHYESPRLPKTSVDSFKTPEWTIDKHAEFNKQMGITKSILGTMVLGEHSKEDEIKYSRYLNEDAAGFKKKYPDMFEFVATVPAQYAQEAVEEIKYACDELGAIGVYFTSNHGGKYLGHADLEPVWEEINKRNLPVVIHPTTPAAFSQDCSTAKVLAMFEFIADTTRSVVDMTMAGTFAKFPNIKIVVPHVGSFLPYALKRAGFVLQALAMNGGNAKVVTLDEVLSHIYFDMAGFVDDTYLDMLLTITTPDHIVYGTDYCAIPVPMVQKQLNMIKNHPKVAGSLDDIFDNTAKKLFNL